MDTQSNFDFIRNDLYVDHKVVLAMIRSRFKTLEFIEEDIMNFCQEAEREIGDVENMVKFIEIPVPLENNYRGLLPCNIYRILDVYSRPKDNTSRILFNRNKDGRYLYVESKYKLDKVYMNYVGNPVNKNGLPLIVRGHEMACMYYALYNSLMESAMLGKIDGNMWAMIRNESPLRIASAVGSVRHMTHEDWNHLNIIQGNMIPKIGNISLLNTQFS